MVSVLLLVLFVLNEDSVLDSCAQHECINNAGAVTTNERGCSWRTIFAQRWDDGDVAVIEYTAKDVRGRKLRITRGARSLEYSTPDSFLTAFFLSDSYAFLMTIWVSGSAYHVRVYGMRDEDIRLLLEEGSKSFPDIHVLEDGKVEVVFEAFGKTKRYTLTSDGACIKSRGQDTELGRGEPHDEAGA